MKKRIVGGKKEIFDPVRKCFVACTPEEIVRQSYIKYLTNALNIPLVNIAVEKRVIFNRQTRRFDIVVYVKERCVIVVECKAPTVFLTENTLFQAAVYNSVLQADYIVLYNGKAQLICKKESQSYQLCEHLPHFSEMI